MKTNAIEEQMTSNRAETMMGFERESCMAPTAKRMKMEEEESGDKANIFILVMDECVKLSKVVSAIYKIVIDPNFTNIQIPSTNLPCLKPVFTFSCKDHLYPSGMSFVTIGSKLYLMGGSISYSQYLLSMDCDDGIDFKYDLDCYPSHVYVFDSITSSLLDSSSPHWVPPMTSGKPEDSITFVFDDQIFVLSSQNGPQGMTHFETFDFILKKWIKLPLPRPNFFSQGMLAKGSVIMGRKLFVSYFSEDTSNYHLLWYDIDSGSWTECRSFHLPSIFKDSVFVNDTLYSFTENYIVSLSGNLAATIGIIPTGRELEKEYHRICPFTMDNWPVNVIVTSGYFTRRLFHIGGLLKGANNKSACLGFVEFFAPDLPEYEVESMPPCELRFVVLEAIQGKSFKVIHACHFLSDLSTNSFVSAAAASVY